MSDHSLECYREGKVLLIDKPLNWTSFQVVNKIRWAIRKKYGLKKFKVGHAGTLDPLATGLLILCTGKATKEIEKYQAQFKTYHAKVTLGATRPSYDMETEIDQTFDISNLNKDAILSLENRFTGKLMQRPPIFSALKKDGKKLYDLARAGKSVEVEERPIEIFELKIKNIDLPDFDFDVRCSKGTYIRSLAHDMGKALDTGAYLSGLRRTAIGDFSVDDALSVDDFLDDLEAYKA